MDQVWCVIDTYKGKQVYHLSQSVEEGGVWKGHLYIEV